MPLSNIVRTPGRIWLPSYKFSLNWKVLVTKENGTEYDITDYVINLRIDWPATTSLATATIDLDNGGGRYLDLFNGGEKVEIWGEYSETVGVPTYKIYRGKLDNIFFSLSDGNGYTATIESRQVPEAIDILVVEQYSNALISDAIKDLIDKYLSGLVTYTNVTTTTSRVTTSFANVSVWKAIGELLERAQHDGYIDTDMDLHTFAEGSQTNTTDNVALGQNTLSVSRYGKDTLKIKNRVITYGKEDNNLPIIKTEEDSSSQADLWQKDLVVNDGSLSTMDEVQDKADLELLKHTTTIVNAGRFTMLGSPKLNPGEKIHVGIPYCNADGDFKMMRITHTLSPNGFLTDLDLSRRQETIADLFKERTDIESKLTPFTNLNYMENSYYINFEEDDTPWVLSDCEVSGDGRLSIESGESEGVCTFNTLTTDNNVTQCELRIYSNWPDTENDTYQASNDDGTTWESISPGVVHNFTTTGNSLKFRINLKGDSTHAPTYESVALLYK